MARYAHHNHRAQPLHYYEWLDEFGLAKSAEAQKMYYGPMYDGTWPEFLQEYLERSYSTYVRDFEDKCFDI